MFGFCSLQVEHGIFEEIHAYFLIVGHTHGCLDRYYSNLSKYVDASYFIGSPLSLQNLFQSAPSETGILPSVNRQIRTFYDFKSFFKGKLNEEVHNYQIPHLFRFKKLHGRCYMQYKLFSGFKEWLPRIPQSIVSAEILTTAPRVNAITVNPFTAVGGLDNFAESIGINTNTKTLQERTFLRASDTEINLNKTWDQIIELEKYGFAEDKCRMEEEDFNLGQTISQTRDELLQRVQNGDLVEISIENNQNEGFIFWLDHKGSQPDTNLASLKVINPTTSILGNNNPSEDDNPSEGINNPSVANRRADILQQQTNRSISLKAQSYSRAATTALAEHGVRGDGAYPLTLNFSYEKPGLCQVEVDFYKSIDTDKKALAALNECIQEDNKNGYALLPLDHLPEEGKTKLLTKKLSDGSERIAIEIANRTLIRRGNDISDGDEIISRGGLHITIQSCRSGTARSDDAINFEKMSLREAQEMATQNGVGIKNSAGKNKTKKDLIKDLKILINPEKLTLTEVQQMATEKGFDIKRKSKKELIEQLKVSISSTVCLLYTSDAADE